jgi:hypothetical protein
MHFTDNPDDEPGFKKDDIIDCVLNREKHICASMDKSTVYLNRPARVNEPNSSNQSNGEWRRNKKVIRAQSEYDERLNLKEFSDQPSLTAHLQDV